MQYSSKKLMRLIVPAGLCLVVAGCASPSLNHEGTQVVGHAPSHLSPGQEPGYVNWNDRTDKVSLHGGDAVAFNRHVQYENPWPRYQNRTHIHMDGEVADIAIDKYKSGNVEQPSGETATGAGSGS